MFVPLLFVVTLIGRRLSRREVSLPEQRAWSRHRFGAGRARLLPAVCLCVPILVVVYEPRRHVRCTEAGVAADHGRRVAGPMPADPTWRRDSVDPRMSALVLTHRRRRGAAVVNVYGQQAQGHELIFFSNSVAPSERWNI